MKRNQFIILLLLAYTTILPTYAAQNVYHSEKLPDGSTINWCRFGNGKIDYCTLQDSLKDLDRLHNPQKYMTTQQKKEQAKLESYKIQTRKTFPIIDKFEILKKTYEQEAKNLENKSYYGVSVDQQKLQLLQIKLALIKELENPIIGENDKIAITGYAFIDNKYSDALRAKDNNIITTSELKELENKLQEQAKILETYYNKLLTMNTIPLNYHNWVEVNNPNYNVSDKIKKRIINNAVNEYVPAEVKMKFNSIMNLIY